MSLSIRNIASSLFSGQRSTVLVRGQVDLLASSMGRLNASLRVTQQRDAVSSIVLSASLTAIVRGYEAGLRNTEQGRSMVDISRDALAAQTQLVQQLQGIALQSASSEMSDSERLGLDSQAQNLVTEVGRIARSASFKQLPLLEGMLGTVLLQVGPSPQETVPLRFDRTATSLALGLLGGNLGPPTYSQIGTGVSGNFVTGDLKINGSIAGTLDDAAQIAQAINALSSQYGASASNEVSGLDFQTLHGPAPTPAVATVANQSGPFVAALSDGQTATATQSAQNGAFVVAVSDGVTGVATQAVQNGAYLEAVSDGVAGVATQAAQSGAFVEAVSDGVAVVATHADQSGAFVNAVSDGVAVVATQAAQSGTFVDAVSDGVAVVATHADQSGAFVDAVSDGVAAVASHADQSGSFVTAVSDGVDVVATHADQSGSYIAAVSDGVTPVATHADQSGTFVEAVSDGVAGVATYASLSGGGVPAVSDGAVHTGMSGAFLTVTPPNTGEWQFQFTVGTQTIVGPTSSVVTAADIDAALAAKAADLMTFDGISFNGTVAAGDLVFTDAQGDPIQIIAITTDDTTVPPPGVSNPGMGFGQNAFGAAGDFNENMWGNSIACTSSPFTMTVDGTIIFTKAGGAGVDVSGVELDAAFAAFANASNGLYVFSGNFDDATAALSKTDGTALDIEITSNFTGSPGTLPGMTGITNNGTQAVGASTPFELKVDGVSVFQKAAAPDVRVTALELDQALADFAANSNGAYGYSGSLANGTASLTKADGSAIDVQLASNFSGTAGALPGLTGITNNGTQGVPGSTPFELRVDGVSIFQKAAAPGETVTAAELDQALTDFAANNNGAYGYSGSLANGTASLTKADGSAVDVQLASNFSGTSGALPGLAGITANGTQAVAATTPFELQVDGVTVFQKAAAPGETVTATELDTALSNFATNSNGAYFYSGSLANGDANLTKADGSVMDVELSSNFAGTAGDLPGLLGIANNGTEAVAATTPFELQVDGITVFQKMAAPGETVTAAELDAALSNFATNSNGAYIFSGSLANGDASLIKADGSAIDVQLTSNFAGTAGDLPGLLGIANNGTEAVAATTPFELQVDGVTVFQKAAAPGETVTAAELDTALSNFATNSNGAYFYSGSLANGDANLTKADGSVMDVELSSNFAGTAGDLPGLLGIANNGTEAVAATTPFELQVDGITVFQKAAAPGETVTAAEIDTALSNFATTSSGAYSYTGSLANGNASLVKADGSALDVELSSNFAGTAGDLPGLVGLTNNGTQAVAATTPFQLKVDGISVFQKAAAPGATVTASELDTALLVFAVHSNGAYSYTGSLANGDANLSKADGSAIDVVLSSNFAATAGDLPGLVGITNNGTQAVAATTPFQLKVDGVSVFQKAAAVGATVTATELDAALADFAANSNGAYTYSGSLSNGDANLSKANGSAINMQLSSNFAGTAGDLPGLLGITNNGTPAVIATIPFQLKVDGTWVFQKAATPGATVTAAELDTALSDFAVNSSGAYTYSGSLANGNAILSRADGRTLNVQLVNNFAGTAGALPGIVGLNTSGTRGIAPSTPFRLKVDGATVFQKNAGVGVSVTAAELDTAFADFAANSNGAYSYSGSLVNGDASLHKSDGTPLNVQITSNFAATPGALPGLSGTTSNGTGIGPVLAPDYQFTLNGAALDLSAAAADGSITIDEIADAINGVAGMSAQVIGGKLNLKKADGGNITLSQSGADAANGGFYGGVGSTVYRGSVNIRSNTPITIAGDDPAQAGLQPGTLVAQYLAYVGINLRDQASAGIAVRVSEVALELLRNYSTVFSGTSDRLNGVSEFIAGLQDVAERARDRALDRSSAAETAAAARLQILRDAGSALVAQANVNTRTVLSLLKQNTAITSVAAGSASVLASALKPAAR